MYDCSDKKNRILLKKLHDHTEVCCAVSVSNDGSYLLTGGWDDKMLMYDCSDKNNIQLIKQLKDHDNWVKSVAWSPDDKHFASRSSCSLCIYEFDKKQVQLIKRIDDVGIFPVSWSSTGYLASGSLDTICIYNIFDKNKIELRDKLDDISTSADLIAWSHKGDFLVVMATNGNIFVYACSREGKLQLLEKFKHYDSTVICSIVWGGNDNYLAMGVGTEEAIYDISDKSNIQFLKRLENYGYNVASLAWNNGSNYLISGGGGNGGIVLHDLSKLNSIDTLQFGQLILLHFLLSDEKNKNTVLKYEAIQEVLEKAKSLSDKIISSDETTILDNNN